MKIYMVLSLTLLFMQGVLQAQSSEQISKKFELHAAAQSLDPKDIQSVLKKKSLDLNEQDEQGYTALHLACLFGIDRIVETLVQAGAKNRLRNNNKERPSDVARRWGHHKIALYLELHDDIRETNKRQKVLLVKMIRNKNFSSLGIRKLIISYMGNEKISDVPLLLEKT